MLNQMNKVQQIESFEMQKENSNQKEKRKKLTQNRKRKKVNHFTFSFAE